MNKIDKCKKTDHDTSMVSMQAVKNGLTGQKRFLILATGVLMDYKTTIPEVLNNATESHRPGNTSENFMLIFPETQNKTFFPTETEK